MAFVTLYPPINNCLLNDPSRKHVAKQIISYHLFTEKPESGWPGEPDLEKRIENWFWEQKWTSLGAQAQAQTQDNLSNSIVAPQIFLIFHRLYFVILKLYYCTYYLHFQPAYYQFGYQVDTLDTGDYHGHMEQLDGNVKRGKY